MKSNQYLYYLHTYRTNIVADPWGSIVFAGLQGACLLKITDSVQDKWYKVYFGTVKFKTIVHPFVLSIYTSLATHMTQVHISFIGKYDINLYLNSIHIRLIHYNGT